VLSSEYWVLSEMKKIERFEDLIAWQKARGLAQAIYQVTREREFARDIGLSGQIQRAAVSVMANIAEGFERNRSGEFHQFLSVAKGSCAEVRSHLYAAHDARYLGQSRFAELLVQAEEVGRIVGGLRASVAGRRRQSHDSDGSVLSAQHSALSTQH
jgi:four helix bundle protein